jgi:hypothetical protein
MSFLETVQKKCCSQCLFTKNKIVSDSRKEEILKDCKDNNKHFICHKASIRGLSVTCHAFYKTCTKARISKLLEEAGLVDFVDIK